jgi:hypothetical protein
MLTHGVTPEQLLLSAFVPIPKNKRKSLNDSDNYRGIALSSAIGKLFDWLMLMSNKSVLKSSNLQFGYKEGHSTTHCTFVLNEVINHYNRKHSDVYVILLDASKAFDRVNYVKLFKLLIDNGICPLVAHFLDLMYTNQLVRVKWNSHVTPTFKVSNGVKQGGVLSPILFSIYDDNLLYRLESSGVGCHIGNVFMGALAYADDVTLLGPSRMSINKMLQISNDFSKEYDVLFNHKKSNLLTFHGNNENCIPVKGISFDNSLIECVNDGKHLGNIIGKNATMKNIQTGISDFYGRVNVLIAQFKHAFPWIKYKLFKTFCMPLYGVQLWDLSNVAIESFYVAWRKSIRRLFDLPQKNKLWFIEYLV